jgi:hypothetical protein
MRDDREGARCASARGVDLTRADLSGAHMVGIDLREAKLEEAHLEGAELANAILAGANLSSAHLEKADITGGVQAQGANFLNAALQGADLTGAQLQFADLSSAGLQGAMLNFAQLQAAVLRDADLEGSSLQHVKLHGADLTGMKIAGADLRGAVIWMTVPPQWDTNGLADLSELALKPFDDAEQASLKSAMGSMPGQAAKSRAREALAALIQSAKTWSGTPEQLRWQSWSGASPPPPAASYRADLTAYLMKMMCSARWSDGSIATGVVRRAISQQFRGDPTSVYDKLHGGACVSSQSVADPLMRELSVAAEQTRVPAPAPAQPTGPAAGGTVPGMAPPPVMTPAAPATTSTLPGAVSTETSPAMTPATP